MGRVSGSVRLWRLGSPAGSCDARESPTALIAARCFACAAGKVPLTRKAIAQLIGKVFIQKSAVNLLSTVLDTPEFFWSAPDSMQVGRGPRGACGG